MAEKLPLHGWRICFLVNGASCCSLDLSHALSVLLIHFEGFTSGVGAERQCECLLCFFVYKWGRVYFFAN